MNWLIHRLFSSIYPRAARSHTEIRELGPFLHMHSFQLRTTLTRRAQRSSQEHHMLVGVDSVGPIFNWVDYLQELDF